VYAAPFTVPNGSQLTVWSMDHAGNEERPQTIAVP
jgi:hypothetical protein